MSRARQSTQREKDHGSYLFEATRRASSRLFLFRLPNARARKSRRGRLCAKRRRIHETQSGKSANATGNTTKYVTKHALYIETTRTQSPDSPRSRIDGSRELFAFSFSQKSHRRSSQ
jgi:hypothetical protein